MPFTKKASSNKDIDNRLDEINSQLEHNTSIYINALNPPAPFKALINDGIHDNTSLLQDLLDNYSNIFIPNQGEYKFNSNIVLNDNNVLFGENTKLVLTIDANGWARNIAIKGSNVKIYNFRILNGGIGIGEGNFENIEIFDNYIENYVSGICCYNPSILKNVKVYKNKIYNQVERDDTTLWNRQGHGAIAFTSTNLNLENVDIYENEIMYTNTFGIAFGTSDKSNFIDVNVYRNKIYYTGVTRILGLDDYQGCCGIYGGSNCQNINVNYNDIKYSNENGIEGSFNEVIGNKIEATAWDRFYRPNIVGNGAVGIFGNCKVIKDNILKNCGSTKGVINYYNESKTNLNDTIIENNTIIEQVLDWEANTKYRKDNEVKIGLNIYKCIQDGTSGQNQFIESNSSEIVDNTCKWVFEKSISNYGIYIQNIPFVKCVNNNFIGTKRGILLHSDNSVLDSNKYIDLLESEYLYDILGNCLVRNENNYKLVYDLDFSSEDELTLINGLEKISKEYITNDNDKFIRITATNSSVLTNLQIKNNITSESYYYQIVINARFSNTSDKIIVIKNGKWGKYIKHGNDFEVTRSLEFCSKDTTLSLGFNIANQDDYIDILSIKIYRINL